MIKPIEEEKILADETEDDVAYIKQAYPQFEILSRLEAGTSFGEVALKDCVTR